MSRDLLTCGGKIASGDIEVRATPDGQDGKPRYDKASCASPVEVLQTPDPGWAIADGSVGDS